MIKPFSQACVNNQDAILDQLERLLADSQSVLEIGSGTGQHGVYFAQHMPHIVWQTSDLAENHEGIHCWLEAFFEGQCLAPIAIDICRPNWGIDRQYDAVFTANTLHICSWAQVTQFFRHVHQALSPQGRFIIYGPFNYGGAYTSESNERFDQFLQASHPERGIRDTEKVVKLAQDNHLTLIEDQPMPANNRLLVFQQLDS